MNFHAKMTARLDEFFESKQHQVLFFKGPWGIGKSWFVRHYLESSKVVPKYQSYVSLFGLTELNEVRESINASFIQKKEKWGAKSSSDLSLSSLEGVNAGEVAALGSFLYLRVVKNLPSLVVFDDLERCTIPAEHLLGLASHLSENTQAKVIVIYHEDKISGANRSKLNEYREKTVDLEVLFHPDASELIDSFLEKKSLKAHVQRMIQVLDRPSIRLLQKINFQAQQMDAVLQPLKIDLSPKEWEDVATLVALHDEASEKLTSARLQQAFALRQNRNEKGSADLQQLAAQSEALGYVPGLPLEAMTLELIHTGFCSPQTEKTFVARQKQEVTYLADYTQAFEIFFSNFAITPEQVQIAQEKFLAQYAGTMETEDLVRLVHFIKSIGSKIWLEPWIRAHLAVLDRAEKTEQKIALAQHLARDLGEENSPVLLAYIERLRSQKTAASEPWQVITQLCEKNACSPEDALLLDSLSDKEVLHLLKQKDDKLIGKLHKTWKLLAEVPPRGSHAFIRNLGYALIEEGRKSPFKKLQILKSFGLEVDAVWAKESSPLG